MVKLGTSMALAAALLAGNARAAGPPRAQGATAGNAGPCARSLDALDRAIGVGTDPALRRERGVCHESLGHPYPAMDDYRAYLTARPDAPDADDTRMRLERLEAATASTTAATEVEIKAGPRARGVGARKDDVPGKKRSLSEIERAERLEAEADASPLRRGRGLWIGVEIDAAHVGDAAIGWTETVAVDLRYSLSAVSALLLELGFAHASSTGTSSSLGGGAAALGYEARLALDPRLDNALLLGVTLGYEALTQRSTGAVYDLLIPEARLGYRHVIGPSLGLEAAFDGGVAWLHRKRAPVAIDADGLAATLGGHVALVVGF